MIKDHDASSILSMREFMESTDDFLHLLDIAELSRIVQAAQIISSRSENVTPMMAFDCYLVERAEKVCAAGTLSIKVLLRFVDE